jgi:hypothetical protein
MNTRRRLWALVCVTLVALAGAACDEGGIGMGVPSTGARWGGTGSAPTVLVAGGPSFR